MKICTNPKCNHKGKKQSFSNFHKDKTQPSGYCYRCKDCKKQYIEDTKEDRKKYRKNYYYENREESLKKSYEWRDKNRDLINKRKRERRKNDPMWKLNANISCLIRNSISKNNFFKSNKKWSTLVDYTLEELKKHLENLFENEMCWNNYGEWHVDHIVPIAVFSFESANDEQFKKCWSLENLQPLWAEGNSKKQNKISKHFNNKKLYDKFFNE